jgi:hypothetical protein
MSQAESKSPRGALLEEILEDPDRDRIPGARPVLSYHENDEPDFLQAVQREETCRISLSRRGIDHGTLVELRGQQRSLSPGRTRRRWKKGRPILLPGVLSDVVAACALPADDRARVAQPGGLRAWFEERASSCPPGWSLDEREHVMRDPERDLESLSLRREGLDTHFWLKTTRLSTYAQDQSLRLRFSFGEEIADDASNDERAHEAVTELARGLVPLAPKLESCEPLQRSLTGALECQALLSQHIVYWNSPHGGARFHHDAFGDPDPSGQHGVCYAQLSGRTLWLALSIRDLAQAVYEFSLILSEGQLRPVRELFFEGSHFTDFLALAREPERCVAELALPGCGELGPLVDHCPEFTALLADRGHALLLAPGDVLLLPNLGFACTAMHSVFSASDEIGEALSVAIRARG